MARQKFKVNLVTGTQRVIELDPKATVGATLGTDLRMPDGALATPTLVATWLGLEATGAVVPGGTTQHSQLEGLSSNDHPQYALAAALGAAAFSNSYNDLDDLPAAVEYDPDDGLAMFDDLDGTFSANWTPENSGAGSAVSRTGVAGRGGVITLATGTTTTGYARAIRGSSVSAAQPVYLASDTYPLFLEAEVRVSTLPSSAEQFALDIGFRATLNASNALASIGIRWDATGSAAAFVVVTRTTAGSITTTVGTGATPAANTWHRMRLEVGATYVKGYVYSGGSWVEVANVSATIPDAAMAAYMANSKQAGTTSRTAEVDWIEVTIPTAGGRPA